MRGALLCATAAVAAAVVLASPDVRAAGPSAKECIAAADEGQRLRDEGKLTAARDKFATCGAKACPGVVAKQCGQWLEEVAKEMPSVTFRVLDEHGKELIDVRVLVDGEKVADAVEAKSLSLDPGEHVVKVERADGRSAEDKIMLRPGERNRLVQVSFRPEAPAAPPSRPEIAPPAEPEHAGFRVPLLGWVGLGVGVAGGVTTAVFAIMANHDESSLRSSCAPSCATSEKGPIHTKLVVANVGLGVGIVGLGVAVVATVLANKSGAPRETPKKDALLVDFGPSGVVGVRGAF